PAEGRHQASGHLRHERESPAAERAADRQRRVGETRSRRDPQGGRCVRLLWEHAREQRYAGPFLRRSGDAHPDLRLAVPIREHDPLRQRNLEHRRLETHRLASPAGRGSARMTAYITRRLATAVPTLILISMVVFGILALAPGDPLGQFAANPDIPPEVRLNIL